MGMATTWGWRAFFLSICIVAVLTAAYLGVSATVLSVSLAPRPVPDKYRTPLGEGVAAEEVRFTSARDDVTLAGWLLPSTGKRVIVLVHGVDSHGWHGAQPDLARAYVSAGFHVLTFDLRGHGRSGGKRHGLGWDERADVRAAVDLLISRGFRPGSIGIHGTSYGAATALISAASIPELCAVVADSAFADVRELMSAQIEARSSTPPWLSRLLLRPGIEGLARVLYGLDLEEITPVRVVRNIAPRPLLFIHGERDRTIPVSHAHRLRAASKGPADQLWVLRGLDHTEGVRMGAKQRLPSPVRKQYLATVLEFFDRALDASTSGCAPISRTWRGVTTDPWRRDRPRATLIAR